MLVLIKLFFTTVLLVSSSAVFAKSKEKAIDKSIVLKATKKQVWTALTSSNELGRWWNKGVKLEPHIGGTFYEPWGDNQLATGRVLKVRDLNFIEFTWQEKYWEKFKKTKCSFTLRETSDSTILEVKHSGWEIFKNNKRKRLQKGFSQGWDSLLSKLKIYIESK